MNPGASFRYYVRAAGGATATGDEKRAYVIQPNGKIEARERILWVFVKNPVPRPGATVVVPTLAPQASRADRATTLALVAQTLASIAAAVALLR
jgi:hypothetical protein